MVIVGTLLVLRRCGCSDSGISQSPTLQHRPKNLRGNARVNWYMMQRETRPSLYVLYPTGQQRLQSANLTIPTCFRHGTYTIHRRPATVGVIVEMAIPN